jgi:hypothetical protein
MKTEKQQKNCYQKDKHLGDKIIFKERLPQNKPSKSKISHQSLTPFKNRSTFFFLKPLNNKTNPSRKTNNKP